MSEDDKKPDVTDEVPTLPTKAEPAAETSDKEPTQRKPQGKVIIQSTVVEGDAPAKPSDTTVDAIAPAGARGVTKTLPSSSIDDDKTREYVKPTKTAGVDDKTVVNPRPKASPKAAPTKESGPPWILIGAVLVAAAVAGTFIVLSLREREEDATSDTTATPKKSAAASTQASADASAAAPTATTTTTDTTATSTPTSTPTSTASTKPTSTATGTTTTTPSAVPSGLPSWIPTSLPTTFPTALPSGFPSTFPFPTATAPSSTATAKPSATK